MSGKNIHAEVLTRESCAENSEYTRPRAEGKKAAAINMKAKPNFGEGSWCLTGCHQERGDNLGWANKHSPHSLGCQTQKHCWTQKPQQGAYLLGPKHHSSFTTQMHVRWKTSIINIQKIWWEIRKQLVIKPIWLPVTAMKSDFFNLDLLLLSHFTKANLTKI